MDEWGLGAGAIEDVELLGGGTQNVLLRFRRRGRHYVLRRPPEHKRANSDETMRREARVLEALAGSEVPHPRFIAGCPDLDVIGAAFYLMEPVDGFNPTVELPDLHATDADVQRDLGFAMVDGLIALGRLDPPTVGLADLGRPDGWLERQVGRWKHQLDTYLELEGYPGDQLPGVTEVARWLEARRPTSWRVGLIHGDFHLANVLVRWDAGALAAIVDWELTTQGDPLLDLGHLLATWPTPGRPAQIASVALPELPSAEELIGHYAAHSERDLGDITWFRVLACFRLGIILEGTHARAMAGRAPKETGDLLHAHATGLLEQARELIG